MLDSIRSKDGEIESLRSAQHRLVAKTEALERACRCSLGVLSLMRLSSRLVWCVRECRPCLERALDCARSAFRCVCVCEVLLLCWFGVLVCRGRTLQIHHEKTKQHVLNLGHHRDPPPCSSDLSLPLNPVPGRPRKKRPTWRKSWQSPAGGLNERARAPKDGDGKGGGGTETEGAAAPGMGCLGAPWLPSPRRGGRRRG